MNSKKKTRKNEHSIKETWWGLLSPIIDVGDNLMYTFVCDVKSEWRIFNGFWRGKISKWNSVCITLIQTKSESLKKSICKCRTIVPNKSTVFPKNRLFTKNNRFTPKISIYSKKNRFTPNKTGHYCATVRTNPLLFMSFRMNVDLVFNWPMT